MTLDKSALTDLIDALRAGGDLDVLREAMGLVLQALIEAEADQAIGAGRYERAGTRTTHRNGGRDRLVSTKAGDLNLRISPRASPQGDQAAHQRGGHLPQRGRRDPPGRLGAATSARY